MTISQVPAVAVAQVSQTAVWTLSTFEGQDGTYSQTSVAEGCRIKCDKAGVQLDGGWSGCIKDSTEAPKIAAAVWKV